MVACASHTLSFVPVADSCKLYHLGHYGRVIRRRTRKMHEISTLARSCISIVYFALRWYSTCTKRFLAIFQRTMRRESRFSTRQNLHFKVHSVLIKWTNRLRIFHVIFFFSAAYHRSVFETYRAQTDIAMVAGKRKRKKQSWFNRSRLPHIVWITKYLFFFTAFDSAISDKRSNRQHARFSLNIYFRRASRKCL